MNVFSETHIDLSSTLQLIASLARCSRYDPEVSEDLTFRRRNETTGDEFQGLDALCDAMFAHSEGDVRDLYR